MYFELRSNINKVAKFCVIKFYSDISFERQRKFMKSLSFHSADVTAVYQIFLQYKVAVFPLR
jgi:hypothetical protein